MFCCHNLTKLIPVINSYVGVGGPQEDTVNTAISRSDVLQVFLDSPLPTVFIVEEPVVDHQLGLDEGGPGPGHLGNVVVDGQVQAGPDLISRGLEAAPPGIESSLAFVPGTFIVLKVITSLSGGGK